MKWDVILELMDGRRQEATLARPFLPEENEIKVIVAGTGHVQTYSLSKICCIQMLPKSHQIKISEKKRSIEEVTTVAGNHYVVNVFKDLQGNNGFYGLSTDAGNPFKLIFFTNAGVKVRRQERLVGEILEESGLITSFAIETALKEQQALRERRLGEIISEQQNLPHQAIDNLIENAHKEGKVSPRMKVGDILIEAGLVTKDQLDTALNSQDTGKRKKIGKLLVEKGVITENQLLMALALKFRLPFVDLDKAVPTPKALKALPVDIVYALQVLPLETDGRHLVVATSEPTDHTIPDSLRFYTKQRIDLVVASSRQISNALLKYYPKKEYGVGDFITTMSDAEPVLDQEIPEADISESDSEIVTLVNKILVDAYAKGASDIHFEPSLREHPFQVRYRIDGVCRVSHQIPATFKRAVISRIKIMSNLDISERRKAQSGKIVIWNKNSQIEYRVEVTPTVGNNEAAVLRILTSPEPLSLEEMGFSEANLNAFRHILSQPYGIILCVGPTGSGKTTTLHSALKHLNTPEVKIWTVEDPVEITQRGLMQVQVTPKIGLTFQEVLRSLLRADPDIIMIGEMRDGETAKTAIDASLTGHLVLSTLHTNSAPETVTRLVEMGMDPFNFADALLGVLAQRLARRLCLRCRKSYHPGRQEYNELVQIYGSEAFKEHGGPAYSDAFTLMKKTGCEACNDSGYKGRVAIHELLINTDGIKTMIRRKAVMDDLRGTALAEGMKTLLMDGIDKIIQGHTDLSEILQVCRHEKNVRQNRA
jgi:type II secretory ATPase GspE/PulE/Tfp pilus assembly ATPase PilB-like protein